jgi:prepilin-type N-terminal cleavage/methylation domain-containing protein
MKRKAFTLVELMVVIAIIALLVVLVMPSMSTVYSLARATICRGQLEKLGGAFAIAQGQKPIYSAGNPALLGVYPKKLTWPSIPRNAVDDPVLYHCPEDPNKGQPNTGSMFKQLEYENEYGTFALDVLTGASGFYKSRSGEDPVKGGYTDYLLQDDYGNGQFELMTFNGWIDSDGVIRTFTTPFRTPRNGRSPTRATVAGREGPAGATRVAT